MSKETLNCNDLDGHLQLSRKESIPLQDTFNRLRVSAAEVGELDNKLKEGELREELERDLQRLIEEAETPQGNAISKRIYNNLDDWLRTMLKAVVKPRRKEL